LIGLAAKDARISADMAAHISTVGIALRQALPANDLFEQVTGSKTARLSAWLKNSKLMPPANGDG
ncbi:hypothetical protein ABTM87_19180, partial [Acinetobacter baumannii]